MSDLKLNKQCIENIYQNAHIALQSISDILPECDHSGLTEELRDEYEGYEKFIGKTATYIKEHGYDAKEVGPMKKAFMYTSVKMNTMTDDSRSHIADLMVKGTVMGITELRQILSRSDGKVDEEILSFARELLEIEESYEKRLKDFL